MALRSVRQFERSGRFSGIWRLYGLFVLFSLVTASSIFGPFLVSNVQHATPSIVTEDATWQFQNQNQQNTGYSNQSIINASNVGSLSLRWSLKLGATREGGLSGSPVIVNGTVFVTSSSSIYAINESTGRISWSDGPSNGTGALSTRSGVTIDNGSVFVSTFSNLLVKLNAKTGTLEQSTSIVQNVTGSSISYQGAEATPLVFRGRVILGETLGDRGARGLVRAFNETDLAPLWTFYTVPPSPITTGTNQSIYANSWGTNGSSGCTCGGGAVWNVPAADPSTGIIYFGTGNPSPGNTPADVTARVPSYSNGMTAFPNLFTDSILALNSTSGKLIWYFQEVPGDQIDHDQGMPLQLFSTLINGSSVPAKVIGAGGKAGYYFALNATTGKMFYKVKIGVHENDNASAGEFPPSQIFPGMDGGDNTFSSFNPLTNMIYTIASNKPQNCTLSAASCPHYPLNSSLIAINASTGNIVWTMNFTNGGLSGGVSSSNSLVFTSDGNHTFYALNGYNGNILWARHDPSGGGTGTVLWTWGAPSVTNGILFETTMGTSSTGVLEAFSPRALLPSISISESPTSGSANRGSTISLAEKISGGTQVVSLSIKGLPNGVRASWSSNPVIDSPMGASVKLSLKIASTARVGTFTLTITAKGSDGKSASMVFKLIIK